MKVCGNVRRLYDVPCFGDMLFINSVELQKIHLPWLNLNISRFRRQSDDNGDPCTLPPYPENGRWSVVNGEAEPGDSVDVNTLLTFECDEGYRLTKSKYVACGINWNVSNLPQCESRTSASTSTLPKLCPPITSTPKITVRCVSRRGTKISCSDATDGAYLTYKCAPFYETPFGYKKTLLCIDGTWNYPKPVCEPVCGKKINDDDSTLIYGGQREDFIEYPWVIALYFKMNDGFTNVCGGTIVTPRVVLTAAHCVTNGYGDVLPKENYRIGAGILYNQYKDSRDTNGQFLEVSRIIVHPGYKAGSRHFQADIAMLITAGAFALNDFIQPVCFNNLNSVNIYAGNLGVVAGWGIQDDGLPAEKLNSLEIPYKYETTCTQELPREWADKYAMIDKICAGFYNKSTSVCKGDSGGGLAFKNPEDNRYYIHGVVSIGPSQGGECNIQQNSLYTKVAFYYEFLDKEISKYPTEECILPPYPKNGKWTISGSQKKPGNTAAAGTPLKYQCNKGFTISSASEIDCDSPMTKPTCLAHCPIPSIPSGAAVSCKNRNGNDINCADALEGASLSYTCPSDDGSPGTQNVRTCKNGSWGSTTLSCEPKIETDPLPASPSTPTLESKGPKVICSYASWQSYKGVNPENLNVSLCTHLVYAFIGISSTGKVRIQDERLDVSVGRSGLYYRLTDLKKMNPNLKVLLSVGGSAASNASLFSSMAADPAKISAFITSATEILRTYNFDGLEIEWLTPSVQDKSNYITLLRKVKQELKKNDWLVTASVQFDPAETGYDAAEMNKILDWVTIRSYDMYGPWSEYTGQTSPLYASSKEFDWQKNHLNLDATARNWLTVGLTKNKMVLSIAFFGRSFTLKDPSQRDIHAPISGAGPGESEGFLRYSEICEKYNDWETIWDNEQKNPYKFSNNKWFGYDDQVSVRLKAEYIRDNKYAGVNVWPVDGDDVLGKCGEKQQLLKQIRFSISNAKNDIMY